MWVKIGCFDWYSSHQKNMFPVKLMKGVLHKCNETGHKLSMIEKRAIIKDTVTF